MFSIVYNIKKLLLILVYFFWKKAKSSTARSQEVSQPSTDVPAPVNFIPITIII